MKKIDPLTEVILRRQYWLILGLLLFLVACGQENDATSTTTTTPAAALNTTLTPTRPRATTTATSSPTPTPEPEPGLSVETQTVDATGQVRVNSVTTLVPAVLALYSDNNGSPDAFLTFVALSPGTTTDVSLTLNPLQATPTLHARLFADEDENDTPDDPDAPLAEASFTVTITAALPTLVVTDQVINNAGALRLTAATVPGPAWAVIHNDQDGEWGDIVGFYPLTPETTFPLTMTLRWQDALPTLQAVLYQDLGERGRFEPAVDLPLLVQDQPVAVPFRATLPLDIYILDQPLIDNEIVIEKVVSNGPGWAVVYADNGGRPGLIIGFAPLAEGLNTAVTISLQDTDLTETLFIWLHEDTGDIGEFEYPQADDVIRVEGRLPTPFSVRTNTNNYLIARDQSFADGQVIVTHVVLNEPGWVVVHNNANGELGEQIGQMWLPAGVSRDVAITIDLEGLTTTLYLVLYDDLGEAEVFEAVDVPFRISGRVISVPVFRLEE